MKSYISYNDETLYSYTLTIEDPEICESRVTYPFSSGGISVFLPEISKFCCIKKCRYRLHFGT